MHIKIYNLKKNEKKRLKNFKKKMDVKCKCKKPYIALTHSGRAEHVSMFKVYRYNIRYFECFYCEWKSDKIKEYNTGNPYSFIGKIYCKIFGHSNLEPLIVNEEVVYGCIRCGFIINNIDTHNRLQKIKKLQKIK